jgi:hypothetical protein
MTRLWMTAPYRDSDLTKEHALTAALADLRRLEGAERIALTGLGADEVAELLSAGAGHKLDADGLALAGELASETGGNPFFVRRDPAQSDRVRRAHIRRGRRPVESGSGGCEQHAGERAGGD